MTVPEETARLERARRFHGARSPRGLADVPHSRLREGYFGRMFRSLPPLEHDEHKLAALGDAMVSDVEIDDPNAPPDTGNNPLIEAGYTYLGQFIDHDITFDPTSRLQRQNDPESLHNFRTPRYDLDSIYGAGPTGEPYLYQDDGVHLRIGTGEDGLPDLPRIDVDRAVIPDPRNDENLIIAQLTLAFMNYHNVVADVLAEKHTQLVCDPAEWLARTQRVVRWHYQWLVVHEFLTRICGEEVVDDVLGAGNGGSGTYPVWTYADGSNPEQDATWVKPNLRFFEWRNSPYIPVEFAAAAFRSGHSMVRDDYAMSEETSGGDDSGDELLLFRRSDDEEDLSGFRRRPKKTAIQWRRFFTFPDDSPEPRLKSNPEVQLSRLINTELVKSLNRLPHALTNRNDPTMQEALPEDAHGARFATDTPAERPVIAMSLAKRNLLRGQALGLPSGQAIAAAMGLPKYLILGCRHFKPAATPAASGAEAKPARCIDEIFWEATPLWFYILKEAEVFNGGKRLGPVGGRIVAEVLIGLLYGDPQSYLRLDPSWTPTAGEFGARKHAVTEKPAFSMPDLLDFSASGSSADGRTGPSNLGFAAALDVDPSHAIGDRALARSIQSVKTGGTKVSIPMNTPLASFVLPKEVWDNLVELEALEDNRPHLFVERLQIRDGNVIPMDCRQSTVVVYVEGKADGARLMFTRAIGTEKNPDARGLVLLYNSEYPSGEEANFTERYELEKGDRILISDATYSITCDDPNGATLIMAGIDTGLICGGRPCPGYDKKPSA